MPAHLQFSHLYWKLLLLVAAEVRKESVVIEIWCLNLSALTAFSNAVWLNDDHCSSLLLLISYACAPTISRTIYWQNLLLVAAEVRKESVVLFSRWNLVKKTLPWRRFLRGAGVDALDRRLDPRRCPPSSPCPPAWWSGWRGPPCTRRTAPPSPICIVGTSRFYTPWPTIG